MRYTCPITICSNHLKWVFESDTQANETIAASDWGELCVEGCLYNGHHNAKDMVPCCHCASWMHTDCIALKEEYVSGVWPCFKCRQMPSQAQGLVSSVDALTEFVQSLASNIEDLKQQQQQTARLLREKKENCEKLITDNAQLRQHVADVAASSSDERWRQFPRAHGTAVLGSSIIRDVDQNKLVATKCICIPRGHIKDIQAKVNEFPARNRLCRAVLVVGGNDCDGRQDTPISDILAQYKDLIEGAKSIATYVTVSSVCPRRKSTELNEYTDTLYAGLQGLCDDLQVEYVDHSPSFRLQDGTFNEGFLLPDGVHLTRAATNKLVSNLRRLELRQGEVTAHWNHRRRAEGDGPAEDATQTPDSLEQPDLDYSFWQRVTKIFRPCKPKPPPPAQQARSQPQGPPNPSSAHTHHQGPRTAPRGNRYQDMTSSHQATGQARIHGPIRSQASTVPTPLMDISTRRPTPTSHMPSSFPIAPRAQSDSISCQLCLGTGHTAVTCKSRHSQCFKCSKYGHLARVCPT